jgi:hypothetical protein
VVVSYTFQPSSQSGFDNPYNRDLEPKSRSHNVCLFGNVKYTIVSQVVIGAGVFALGDGVQGGATDR